MSNSQKKDEHTPLYITIPLGLALGVGFGGVTGEGITLGVTLVALKVMWDYHSPPKE